MRVFTDEERLIISKLRTNPYIRNFIVSMINEELAHARLRVDRWLRKSYILIERNYYSGLSEAEKNEKNQKVYSLISKISASLSFITLLQEDKLIRMDKHPNDKPSVAEVQFSDTNANIFEITNRVTVRQLIKYSDQRVELLFNFSE
jgi:hypothetical protein